MSSYKEKFFETRKEELKTSYQNLKKLGNNRDQALKVMQPIFGLTPESMKVIMFNKNYNKQTTKTKNT